MAAHGWGTDTPLEQLLFAEGFRFDFYQAVKLLEMLAPDATPVAEGSEPDAEPVRFRSRVGLDFPASEIDLLARAVTADLPPEMRVNFLGLAGVLGPLPLPITELVVERVWHKDTALRDFLDLFNHRLVSILARALNMGESKQFRQYQQRIAQINDYEPELELDSMEEIHFPPTTCRPGLHSSAASLLLRRRWWRRR